LIERQEITALATTIRTACGVLASAQRSHQILEAAGLIAKSTAQLCSMCKDASQSSRLDAAVKQQLLEGTRSVANHTTELVSAIKTFSSTQSEESREDCQQIAQPLIRTVDELLRVTAAPVFLPVQAVIAPRIQHTQKQLVDSLKSLVTTSNELIGAAQPMCNGENNPAGINLLATHTRAIGDALKGLFQQIRTNAPGQRECTTAMDQMSNIVGEIDAASLKSESGNLKRSESRRFTAMPLATSSAPEHTFRTALLDHVKAIASLAPMLAASGKGRLPDGFSSTENHAGVGGHMGALALQLAENLQPVFLFYFFMVTIDDDERSEFRKQRYGQEASNARVGEHT
jgi:talin